MFYWVATTIQWLLSVLINISQRAWRSWPMSLTLSVFPLRWSFSCSKHGTHAQFQAQTSHIATLLLDVNLPSQFQSITPQTSIGSWCLLLQVWNHTLKTLSHVFLSLWSRSTPCPRGHSLSLWSHELPSPRSAHLFRLWHCVCLLCYSIWRCERPCRIVGLRVHWTLAYHHNSQRHFVRARTLFHSPPEGEEACIQFIPIPIGTHLISATRWFRHSVWSITITQTNNLTHSRRLALLGLTPLSSSRYPPTSSCLTRFRISIGQASWIWMMISSHFLGHQKRNGVIISWVIQSRPSQSCTQDHLIPHQHTPLQQSPHSAFSLGPSYRVPLNSSLFPKVLVPMKLAISN